MKNRPSDPADNPDFPNGESSREGALILLVEDDPDYRRLITTGLKDEFRVIEAENGEQGLEKAREHIPDLVVTDLMMPVMDGLELCSHLKADMETSHIPIIMLTAKTSVESQIQGLETGADDYVTKPFNMLLLKTRINNLLGSRVILREQFIREYMLPDSVMTEDVLDQAFIKRVSVILEEHASDPEFNAELFARELNMSLSSLHRKVKAVTGETPAKLIWSARLKKAASLLRSSTIRITDIAFAVGYSDSNHFGRQFKQHYGMTPKEYRAAGASSETP